MGLLLHDSLYKETIGSEESGESEGGLCRKEGHTTRTLPLVFRGGFPLLNAREAELRYGFHRLISTSL